ncbi:2-isopropylmalate synthase [Streptomyces alboniger]|uniref:2-isopropylmalate synthase n=1 Tax=Streptomyces alboniger TaxID=132473 RepID=A0A5J6HTT8_STRAD|nr:2-isopropylmalate synthase [Streptomyces alboniger]QEV21843.1 2-isopropylmalate synthase [Streptomyces alboniger]
MTATPSPLPVPPRITTPAGPRGADQPWWNTQLGSAMPFARYERSGTRRPRPLPLTDRTWPSKSLVRAPLWASVDLRDGNQALRDPMDTRRKRAMFDLLVRMGFKDIEVGYPSASEADFSFVRTLIEEDLIPDDVTISVFAPARPELIDRTFEAIDGVDRAVVHLCHATACLWREVVFAMTPGEVEEMAVRAAEHVARRTDATKGTRLRFQYSPETFNVTEPEFVLRLSNTVAALWDASPDRPVTLNLPTTVETDSPHVFADQVEWMHRNLHNRRSVILSVHPHNDRGTAVASAELAVMAGAERIEGTLFGNGERTGNVCLATLALNLFSQGVDPQLDFSDIDGIRRTVEFANQLPVPPRHPYAGDLVHTAFSGTHQDAIAKGLAAMGRRAAEADTPAAAVPWDVPYLPIDPRDVGRTYESVVRVNSQSGRGGVAHVLNTAYGLDLPRTMRVEFGRRVQRAADHGGGELTSHELHALFTEEYLEFDRPRLMLKEFRTTPGAAGVTLAALVVLADGAERRLAADGPDAATAFAAALADIGITVRRPELTCHPLPDTVGTRFAAYARVTVDGTAQHGAAVTEDAELARLTAVTSAVNRAVEHRVP